MLDQETYNTKISNQIDISVVRIERPLQIRQDLINEGETYEDLEEVTGQGDPFKSDKQDPVSTSSKWKTRKKLIKIANSTEGGWAVVAE